MAAASTLLRTFVGLALICSLYGASLWSSVEDEDDILESGNPHSHWVCYIGDHQVNGIGAGTINTTRCSSSHHKHQWVGYICAIIAIAFFGSNFVPVKKYDTGDGVFFQWLLCIGIWMVGLVTNFALQTPNFFIASIVGGALWCTGNLAVVPIIKMIGMTMGLTVWGVTNMLTGWVIGTFVLKQDMSCEYVSFGGVALVICSVVILAFVKSEGRKTTERLLYEAETQALLGEKTNSLEGSLNKKVATSLQGGAAAQDGRGGPGVKRSDPGAIGETYLLPTHGPSLDHPGKSRPKPPRRNKKRPTYGVTPAASSQPSDEPHFQIRNSSPNSINNSSNKITFSPSPSPNEVSIATMESADDSWVDKLGVWQKRVIGFGMSLVIGVLFAFIMLPVQFLKLCDDPYHSCSDIDYLFGVYCGILLASTFYMFVYSGIKWNKPKLYPKTVIPGIISGIMWGIAMLCWFEANGNLSLAVSFPLVTAGPGFVSSAWGIIVYREIKGWKNIVLYLVAFSVSLCGLIINGLAKETINCGTDKNTHHNKTMW